MWQEIVDRLALDSRLSQSEKENMNLGKLPNGNHLDLGMINDTATYKKLLASEKTLLTGATASRNGAAGTVVLRNDDGQVALAELSCYGVDIDNPAGFSYINLRRNTGYFSDILWYTPSDSMTARIRLDTDDNFNITTSKGISIIGTDYLNLSLGLEDKLNLSATEIKALDDVKIEPASGDANLKLQPNSGSVSRISFLDSLAAEVGYLEVTEGGVGVLDMDVGLILRAATGQSNDGIRTTAKMYLGNGAESAQVGTDSSLVIRNSSLSEIRIDSTGSNSKWTLGTGCHGDPEFFIHKIGAADTPFMLSGDGDLTIADQLTAARVFASSYINTPLYKTEGYNGQTSVFTFVNDLRYSNMGILQMKKQSFQVRNGIVTMVGQVSPWNIVPTEKV